MSTHSPKESNTPFSDLKSKDELSGRRADARSANQKGRFSTQAPPEWELSFRLSDGTYRSCKSSDSKPIDQDSSKRTWKVIAEDSTQLTIKMTQSPQPHGTEWNLSVDCQGPAALWEVAFPVFRTATLPDDMILLPHVSGMLHPASEPLEYKSKEQDHYPSGVISMQCLGVYGNQGGVYIGVHDPVASHKRLEVSCQDGQFEMRWHWPVPNMGVPGTSWEQPGEVLIRSFDGDWFDIAQIYRAWASEKAQWWPREEQAGRPDTPEWFKDNPVWIMSNGPWPNKEAPLPIDLAADKIEKFARYMDDLPCAVHWYNWHQTPYDTAYPNYFPSKEGFDQAISRIQKLGVRVMPYINARLWDMALPEFEETAKDSAVTSEDGSFPNESYEGNTLACMCPTTPLWQKTIKDLTLKLTGPEYGVDGVYLDQISAQASLPCFNKDHHHPLGGGHWWTKEGYWPMLEDIHSSLPNKIFTSECAAEPYLNRLDGYLTWVGYRNQDKGVPLFHAVYAGQVQLFGRLYKWDSWKGPAMRAKTAQALVWGEQLGWILPDVVDDPIAGPFLKRMARIRYNLRDYLARGHMARPPKIKTDGTTITSNWVFTSDLEVTTATVITGAWHHEQNSAVAIILVNIDSEPHTVELPFTAANYGLEGDLMACEWTATENPEERPALSPIASKWTNHIELEPFEARIIEVTNQNCTGEKS